MCLRRKVIATASYSSPLHHCVSPQSRMAFFFFRTGCSENQTGSICRPTLLSPLLFISHSSTMSALADQSEKEAGGFNKSFLKQPRRSLKASSSWDDDDDEEDYPFVIHTLPGLSPAITPKQSLIPMPPQRPCVTLATILRPIVFLVYVPSARFLFRRTLTSGPVAPRNLVIVTPGALA